MRDVSDKPIPVKKDVSDDQYVAISRAALIVETIVSRSKCVVKGLPKKPF